MQIKKHEIWLIDFDPSVWNEIKKTRPAIVISNTYYNISSWTIFVIPISSQEPKNIDSPFHIKIAKDKINNLEHDSYANISQMRSVSKLRFVEKLWTMEVYVVDKLIKKFLNIIEFDVLKLRYLD